MNVFIKKMAQALYRSAEGKSKPEIEAIAERAALMLQSKRLASKRAELFIALEDARRAAEDTYAATVMTREKLSSSESQALRKHLAAMFKHEIELTNVIDPTLVGGFKVRVGDTVIDATLDQQLKKALIHLNT